MFDFLRFQTLYIRLKPDWLSIRVVAKNKPSHEYQDIPCIALEGKVEPGVFGFVEQPKILAVGKEAIQLHRNSIPVTLLLNGFEHPRTIISNFFVAELTLKWFIHQAYQQRFSIISPQMIIQPLEPLEGGLTQIEIRALSELGSQVGARQVYIYLEDTILSDAEVLRIQENKKALKTV